MSDNNDKKIAYLKLAGWTLSEFTTVDFEVMNPDGWPKMSSGVILRHKKWAKGWEYMSLDDAYKYQTGEHDAE